MAGRLGKKDKINIALIIVTSPIWGPVVGVMAGIEKIIKLVRRN